VWHASSFPVLEIRSKHNNSFHSFIMFSDSGYENKRGGTSFILKFSNKSSDLAESEMDEINVVSSINNFLFDVFSVGNSIIINTMVGVHDKGEVSNSLGRGSFKSIVGYFERSSFIKSRLFETVKDIHDSSDSITGLFFKLQEFHHLVVDEFGRSQSEE